MPSGTRLTKTFGTTDRLNLQVFDTGCCMSLPSRWKNRLLIAVMPLGMLLLWLCVIAQGTAGLDALGNPIGGDFAMFYIAANMASQGEWHLLYNEPEQQRRLLELFPGLPLDTYLPYRYPPHLAMLLSPLGILPYRVAHAMWVLGSVLISVITWLALARTFLPKRSELANTCILGLALSPVAAQTIIDGQASLWWLAILGGTWLAIHCERFVLAGMCLALASCKPNVLLLLGLLLVLRYPRMLWGIVPVGLLCLASTLCIAGRECLTAYVRLGSQLATQTWSVETPYWKVQSLLSWTELVFGSNARAVNMFVGLTSIVLLAWWWRNCCSAFQAEGPKQTLTGRLLVWLREFPIHWSWDIGRTDRTGDTRPSVPRSVRPSNCCSAFQAEGPKQTLSGRLLVWLREFPIHWSRDIGRTVRTGDTRPSVPRSGRPSNSCSAFQAEGPKQTLTGRIISWLRQFSTDWSRTIGRTDRTGDTRPSVPRSGRPSNCVALSLGCLINALFNPYTPVYDLVLLSLPLFAWLVHAERAGALAQWLERREVKLIVACVWVGPILSQCLARELATPQQWMPLIMLILACKCFVPQSFVRADEKIEGHEPSITLG